MTMIRPCPGIIVPLQCIASKHAVPLGLKIEPGPQQGKNYLWFLAAARPFVPQRHGERHGRAARAIGTGELY